MDDELDYKSFTLASGPLAKGLNGSNFNGGRSGKNEYMYVMSDEVVNVIVNYPHIG